MTDDELRRLAKAARDARAAYLDAPSFDAEYAWHDAVSALKRHATHDLILGLLNRPRDDKNPLPKLTDKAARHVRESIVIERIAGNSRTAAALEMLMVLHDRVHGLEKEE